RRLTYGGHFAHRRADNSVAGVGSHGHARASWRAGLPAVRGYSIALPGAGHLRDTGTYPVHRDAELCRAKWLASAVFGSTPRSQLDVVHLRARRPGLALGDLRDGHRAELVAQRSDRVGP